MERFAYKKNAQSWQETQGNNLLHFFEVINRDTKTVSFYFEQLSIFYLKVCNVLGKILYSIRKYFVTWDVHPQEKK